MNSLEILKNPPAFQRHLQEQSLAQTVLEARLRNDLNGQPIHETGYDHFMVDFVGHPFNSLEAPHAMIETNGGFTEYTHRFYFGASDAGNLLLVRTSPNRDLHDPESHYIVTGHILRRDPRFWSITELIRRDPTTIKAIIQERADSETNQDSVNEGYLDMSSQGVVLVLPGCRPERFRPMDETLEVLEEAKTILPAIDNLVRIMAAIIISPSPAQQDRQPALTTVN